MAKTYTLQGPIILENLTNQQALNFAAQVINAVPSYSMGTASLNIRAEGPATKNGEDTGTTIEGDTAEELQSSLAEAQAAPKAPEDIVYHLRGRVNLVDLSFEDGMGVINAAMNNIPPDTLVATAMLVQTTV